MTDREMLELAAREAGLTVCGYSEFDHEGGTGLWLAPEIGRYWNPRDDDGDSRRLEVALGLHVEHDETEVEAWVEGAHGGQYSATERWEDHGWDRCAATRLAVLRAAAEIGKAMSLAP